ncbi:sigma-70 family RNA polymerase sigma factor [Pedobacter sp. HMF7647]|uniref:Sigma-70 family RNA polymerase sigma factor n=1 Tax=Hufsiella arboris TaxID=2695275 RepID=A0A7K1YB77_9SPHI|nr:sigma-70 family RNA polymerase sigma factor [Hufsiella arboris]MXV51847.1 sigma-70 family RNA polymerase sigma factor [Hufsiella arboris]
MRKNSFISSESALQLWSDLRAGNDVSYGILIRTFASPLYKYGIRFIDDPGFVEDCIQDVFFELWNRRGKIKQAESVKSYLFKALRLRIFHERPKWKKIIPIDDNPDFLVEFNVESAIIHEELSQEICAKLKSILMNLPKRQKEILYLRFYEGMSQEKIAEVMNLNRQSVYNLLHESILSMRKYWAKSPVYNSL